MASESGSEPLIEYHRQLPDSWVASEPDKGMARPNPAHDRYPGPHQRHETTALRRLRESNEFQKERARLLDICSPLSAKYEQLKRENTDLRHEKAMLFYMERFSGIGQLAYDAAERCFNSAEVPLPIVRDQLLREVVPPEIADRFLDPLEQVFLRGNHTLVPQLVIVNPSEIIMRFSTASENERNAFTTVIRDLQKAWDHRRDEGGRRRLEDDPGTSEQMKTAAKLALWNGYPNPLIAEFFGWIEPDDTPQQRSKQAEKAGEYVRRGTALLGEDVAANVPPGLAERALQTNKAITKNRRQLWRSGVSPGFSGG